MLNTSEIRLIKRLGLFPSYASAQIIVHIRGLRRQRGMNLAEAMQTRLYQAQLEVARAFLKELMGIANRSIPEPETHASLGHIALMDVVETIATRRVTAQLLANLDREELTLLGVPECFVPNEEFRVKDE